jgi:hypothetical protein
MLSDESVLRNLVQRYKVSWEVQPEAFATNSHLEGIGYQIDLAGALARSEHPSPDSRPCEVYEALRRIAEWLVSSKDDPYVPFEIEPFDASVHYSSLRDNRPEVILQLTVQRRCGLGPADPCEKCCLHSTEEKLTSLGAQANRVRSNMP